MAMREAFTVGIVLAAKDMYSGVMAKAQRNLGILQKTSKNSADAFEKSLKRYQGIVAAGATISVISGQLSGKIEEMTRDAIEFSDAMGKIGTVIDVTGTKFKSNQEALESWRTRALDVSTHSLYSASELINDVAYNLMSSGLKADVSMDLLESVSNTAMATIGDLNTTSAIFGRVMNTFGRRWDMSSLEKGERIMNVLSGAVKKFQWTGDILAEGMEYATAAAESMNIPFEDTIAILGMLNTRGIAATKAGTAFMAFIRELPDATKKMGITISDANGKLLPMPIILQNIEKRLEGMSEIERTILLNKALGEEGSKLIKILLGTSDELQQNIADLQKSGTAAEMVASRMNTLSAETKIQEERWRNLRIELGDKAAPMMITLKKGVLDLVDVLGEVPGAKAFVGTSLGIAGMALEAGKAVGPAMTMVGMLGMWRTQAALAAAAQAQLNAQMGAGAAAAGTQALKMGMLGSRGMALVGVLGKISAVGAAAFVGWELGTLLRQIPGLDEAVQDLFATLTGTDLGKDMEKQTDVIAECWDKIRKKIALTTDELTTFILFQADVAKKAGYSLDEFLEKMGRLGFEEAEVKAILKTREERGTKAMLERRAGMTPIPLGALFHPGRSGELTATEAAAVEAEKRKKEAGKSWKGYQTGAARVAKTGLALIHEGEEIRSKAMAGSGTTVNHFDFGDINIDYKSSGSALADGRNLARSLMQELNRMMKIEARRLP